MSKKVQYVSESNIICPFYHYINRKYSRLVCESFLDNATMALSFDNTAGMIDHLRYCCAEDPTKCRYYSLLAEEKYADAEPIDFKKIKEELYYRD